MIFALVDIIRIDSSQVRYLPKSVWLILVILLPFIGAILWLSLGREWQSSELTRRIRQAKPKLQATTPRPQHLPRNEKSTEEQLLELELEIEQDRLRAEIAKRKAQLADKDLEDPDAAPKP